MVLEKNLVPSVYLVKLSLVVSDQHKFTKYFFDLQSTQEWWRPIRLGSKRQIEKYQKNFRKDFAGVISMVENSYSQLTDLERNNKRDVLDFFRQTKEIEQKIKELNNSFTPFIDVTEQLDFLSKNLIDLFHTLSDSSGHLMFAKRIDLQTKIHQITAEQKNRKKTA